jgi:signal transduction histidine kinase/PAS domain-containing protein
MSCDEPQSASGDLRRQAESILQRGKPDLQASSTQELQDLVHDLQVHQIELELQNDTLRETRQALELARDEYAELYDHSPVGYLSVDGDGTITRANAVAGALLACEPAGLVGKPFYRFVAREAQDAFHFFLMDLMSGAGQETVELSMIGVHGARFQARLTAIRWNRVPGPGGAKKRGWRVAVGDITAECEARDALRQSEAREALRQSETRQLDRLTKLTDLGKALSATLELEEVAALVLGHIAALVGAPEAMLVSYSSGLGGQANYVLTLDEGWIDPAASDRYGRWQQLLEDRHRQRRHLRKMPRPLDRSDTPWGDTILVVPLDDDQPVADLVLAGRAFGDDDAALALAAAGRAGQALRNARLFGEVRNLLRQREEVQARLIQSEKMAALGRLTISLSHEINNPAQSILGCLELAREDLAQGVDPESLNRYLSIALQEVRRIAALIERLRDFYRPAPEVCEAVDMDDVLGSVLDLMHSDLQRRNVTVALVHEGHVPHVPVRIDQLQQVFLNLILNAADAMPGGGTLTLRTGCGELRHNWHQYEPGVHVDVQDTGTGMAPMVRRRLFEPFFSTKRGCSGLGLYIAHGIIQAHGGEIEVHSREGEGTRVTVWLPLVAQQQAEHDEVHGDDTELSNPGH